MNLFDFFKFSFHAHNEIADNGADAKPCLSDVYKHTARGEKLQADAALCGRSMVEMLGVLAIIGVLSVGAISGYSKAMMKYKLNKHTEQMSTVINACIRYINDLRLIRNGGAEYPLAPILIKLNEIPVEMIKKNDPNDIYDIFGNHVYIYYHNTNYLGIVTTIDNSDTSLQICRNLITTAKENHANLDRIFFRNNFEDKWSTGIRGDKTCTQSSVCLKNITLKQMDDACRYCASDRCQMYISIGQQ